MALTSNINQFLKDTEKEIKAELKRQESFGKKVVLEGLREISRRSPVDTGFFRANNFLTFNSPTSRTLEKDPVKLKGFYNATAEQVLSTNIASLATKNLFKVNQIIIQNNLNYALRIEAGHSKSQAPAGVYGITEIRLRKLLNKRI